jgi:hypothetical protein
VHALRPCLHRLPPRPGTSRRRTSQGGNGTGAAAGHRRHADFWRNFSLPRQPSRHSVTHAVLWDDPLTTTPFTRKPDTSLRQPTSGGTAAVLFQFQRDAGLRWPAACSSARSAAGPGHSAGR